MVWRGDGRVYIQGESRCSVLTFCRFQRVLAYPLEQTEGQIAVGFHRLRSSGYLQDWSEPHFVVFRIDVERRRY